MNIIRTLEQIRATSGNAKLNLLSQHPELKEILEWTYNPFKKYYFTVDKIYENVSGYSICKTDGSLYPETIDILTGLETRQLSGNEAKARIDSFLSDLKREYADIFAGIINKDLKLGLHIRSINKVFPGLIPSTEDGEIDIPIMLLKTFNEKKANFPLLAAPKLDGVRGRFVNGYLYSRSKKRFKGLDHIETALRNIGNDFDGEIIIPGNIFDDGSGLIRNNKPVPEAEYHIFDVPSIYDNKYNRYSALKAVKFPSFIKVIPHTMLYDISELYEYYKSMVDCGYEGIVVYNQVSYYEDKRSYDWMRLVPLGNADCRCIGIFEGKGKYEGMAGGIYIDFDGKEVKVGTGFSNEDRRKFWEDPNHYIGLICEIEYKEKTKYGSLRQPRFKGWRLDKREPNFD